MQHKWGTVPGSSPVQEVVLKGLQYPPPLVTGWFSPPTLVRDLGGTSDVLLYELQINLLYNCKRTLLCRAKSYSIGGKWTKFCC